MIRHLANAAWVSAAIRAGGKPRDRRAYRLALRRDPCSYCGAIGPGTIDHITALNGGGDDEWDNWTGACQSCNSSKQDTPVLLWMARRKLRGV